MASILTFSMLPEDCVSNIISFTSPADACKAVSSSFTLAAESDLVWQKFLPSDYLNIVEKSVIPLEFSSRKMLFFRLSESTLIDGGRKVSNHHSIFSPNASFFLFLFSLTLVNFRFFFICLTKIEST